MTEKTQAVGEALLDFEIDPNYKKWPVLDPEARYEIGRLDGRQELTVDPDIDLPDYSGPFRSDLRFTDFSREQLVRMLEMCDDYRRVWVGAWLDEVELRFGRQERLDIEWIAWRDVLAPALDPMLREFMPGELVDARLQAADLGRFVGERPPGDDDLGIDYAVPFTPEPEFVERSKEELVTMLLGSHEYILTCNQAVAMQVVLRHSLDDMFQVSWDIWSAKVLPEVMELKARHMRMSGNDVAAFMKDLQIDASAFPGKKFDLTFEMPEPDVGVMTFNKCAAPTMWEALGREDILEKGCHMTCPASIEETAKLYNPNMKMDVLAIPPRVDDSHICCRWQLSMRTPDDPEYVSVEIGTKPLEEQARLMDSVELEIPRAWDEVTPEWMTIALCRDHPDAVVDDVSVVLRDDGTNRRARLGLTYSSGSGPATVFVKAVDPEHAELNARMGGVFNEPRLFDSGVPLPLDHPHVYLALIDEPRLDFILVMEDITARGADPRDSTRPLTIDQAANGVRALARLHSRFWGDRLTKEPALEWVEPFVAWAGMGGGIPRAIEKAGDTIPPEVRAMSGEAIVDNYWTRYIGTLSQGPATLLHGDAHIGNTYVLPDDEVGFLDWQVLRRGNFSLDLGYFLQGAVTIDDRRAAESDLVDVYCDALDLADAERPTRDDVWLRYRASVAHGLAIWLATFSYGGWQRPEVCLALVQRYAAAFVELDSAAAIDTLAR